MTPATTQTPDSPTTTGSDPYRLGWRTVPRWHDDGSQTWERVPLTEWDVLHPQEDDFIVQTDAHQRDCIYLLEATEFATRDRPNVKVFFDHRIDWQVPRIVPHGPDLTVIEGVTEWEPRLGTFPVKDRNARPLLVLEVTSPSTRDIDLNEKVSEYWRAGVPIYILADARERDGRVHMTVLGYRATPEGFVWIEPDEHKRIWIEPLKIWIAPKGDRVVCFDADGQRIPDRKGSDRERLAAVAEAQAEKVRAEAERQRADAEAARAEAEKARANEAVVQAQADRLRADEAIAQAQVDKALAAEMARRLQEMEAELRRLRGQP